MKSNFARDSIFDRDRMFAFFAEGNFAKGRQLCQ